MRDESRCRDGSKITLPPVLESSQPTPIAYFTS